MRSGKQVFKTIRDVSVREVTENQEKDFKKLAIYVAKAKGYRTINGFAADCQTNADYLADVINSRINSYPTIKFLQLIADNSESRVSLKDLKLACGYSLYENNDMEQIKNIHVRRGWFCYANFGDNCLDSEYGGYRMVLVIQNDVGNRHSSTTLVCPLTSRNKVSQPTHVLVGKDCGLQYDSIISTEQTRCITKRRLTQNGIVQKVSECSQEIMRRVEIALLKAEGVISLHVNEEEAIALLVNLNKTQSYKYENNFNYRSRPQTVFA
jgi:mRNA interferase MazF